MNLGDDNNDARTLYYTTLNIFGRGRARDPTCSLHSFVQLLCDVGSNGLKTRNSRSTEKHCIYYGLLPESPGLWSGAVLDAKATCQEDIRDFTTAMDCSQICRDRLVPKTRLAAQCYLDVIFNNVEFAFDILKAFPALATHEFVTPDPDPIGESNYFYNTAPLYLFLLAVVTGGYDSSHF